MITSYYRSRAVLRILGALGTSPNLKRNSISASIELLSFRLHVRVCHVVKRIKIVNKLQKQVVQHV